MNIAHGNKIRSDLTANREQQLNYRRRVRAEPFGIYRPLSDSCREEVEGVLQDILPDVNSEVWWSPKRQFEIRDDMGITYVKRQDVRQAMAKGSIRRGFNFDQMVRRIEASPKIRAHETREVPIANVNWYGIGATALAAVVYDHQLAVESVEIESIMKASAAELRTVEDPDHVTLLRFGGVHERHQKKLSMANRERVAELVGTTLDNAGIYTLEFGQLTVGESPSVVHSTLAAV